MFRKQSYAISDLRKCNVTELKRLARKAAKTSIRAVAGDGLSFITTYNLKEAGFNFTAA